jgi:hypothetical protein
MYNVLQSILIALPAAENIIAMFIHNADSAHKYTVVAGAVNEVAGIVAQVATAAPAAAAASK